MRVCVCVCVCVCMAAPDETSLGSVDKVHAVGREVFPSNVVGVMPQCFDLHTHTHTHARVIQYTVDYRGLLQVS